MSVVLSARQDASWRTRLADAYERAQQRLHCILDEEDEPEEFI